MAHQGYPFSFGISHFFKNHVFHNKGLGSTMIRKFNVEPKQQLELKLRMLESNGTPIIPI